MSTWAGATKRMCRQLILGVAPLLCLLGGAARAQPVEVVEAQRTTPEDHALVRLPDTLSSAPGAAAAVRATYRATVNLAAPPHRLAIYTPGLIAHAQIRFNGHVVDDRLEQALELLPRSIDRIRLIEVPDEFVRKGDNLLEIDAAGTPSISIAPLSVGERSTLDRRYQQRIFEVVIGPAIVAVVVGSVALCVLLLWARRGDALYGYFGLGALAWALHDAWSVLPVSPIPGVHRNVWWYSLFGFFVAMLVIFCVRFAGWRWTRFERALCVASATGPLLLYAGGAAGVFGHVAEGWLLGWIVVVAIGLSAVGHYAWTHRNTDGVLLLLTGGVSLAFGIRDWLLAHAGSDNNPAYLVPYAGLLFVVLAAWMLIDRFVVASRELETMNSELERRVDAKSAQLVLALEQMRDAKEVAEAANRAKSTFLAAASHDLRQPIHALGLYMAALADDQTGAEQREVVQRMKTSLTSLESMFNALLDVSRMDAGAVIPRPRAFALEAMLHRLAEEFAPLAADKGLRLSVRVAAAPPRLHALSDPMLVERIVLNLLGNAVKYTRSGGVLLSCRLRGGAAGHWRVEVWDTGSGIAETDRERVFEEFYQVGNPERDRSSGLGLGLSIVRRLADLLGHRLRLFSVLGRGTRFALDLPCTSSEVIGIAVPAPQGLTRGLVVAVVDDDPEVRDSMQLLLRRWGCRVHAGGDADEVLHCIDAARDDPPHAIVVDYRLRDGRTGIEAIDTLRRRFGRWLPALIVSGDSSPEQLARMQASGFECLSKPVAPARLRRWLVAAARPKAMAEGAAPPVVTPVSTQAEAQ